MRDLVANPKRLLISKEAQSPSPRLSDGYGWLACSLIQPTYSSGSRSMFVLCRPGDETVIAPASSLVRSFFFGNMVMCGHNVDIRRHNISVPGQISYLS